MDWIKTVNNAIEYMEDHLTDRIAIEGGQIMEYRIEKWEAMDLLVHAKSFSAEGFEILRLPEYTWAVFKCVGPMPKAIQDMWEKIYKEWLPVSDYELIPDVDIENYLPGDPSSRDYVSEICIPVRKSGSTV